MSPKQLLPKDFQAVVVAHNWRGGHNLCIGGVGYNKDSFLVVICAEEDRKQFPIGTRFNLVCVEETRGTACEACAGSGDEFGPATKYNLIRCRACKGVGRAPKDAAPK